jgi:hypothetical protein
MAENQINFRAIVGVQKVIDSMRLYYWYTFEPDFSEAKEKIYNLKNELLSERPKPEDISEIRALFFNLIRVMTKNDPNMWEIRSMIDFLSDCPDPQQTEEMMDFILSLLMGGNSNSICEHVIHSDGYALFFYLLSDKNETIRLLALKNLGIMLKLSPKTKQMFEQSFGFSAMSGLLNNYPFTVKTFATIMEIIFGNISPKFSPSMEDSYENSACEIPSLFGTIFELLLTTDSDTISFVIQKIRLSLKSKEIRSIFLLQPDWQKWMLKLYLHVKVEDSKQKSHSNQLL